MIDLEEKLKKLPPDELVLLKWHLQRRPAQTPPDSLPLIWFLLGGRGSGKTLTGSNHVFETAKNLPHTPDNRIIRVALVSETFTDVRITMIEGETGLRSIIPQDLEITWNRSLGEYKVRLPGPKYREIHFFAYSSERPDLLRGPQHHLIWLDEPSKLKDANIEPTSPGTTWSNLIMGLRLGPSPHMVVTGTPEPNKLVRYIAKHPHAIMHRMSTFENEANLPQQSIEEFRRLPATSRTARQELYAEILEDNPDAIIAQELIENNRSTVPEDINLVLGYDPSMTANTESDEAGIVLSGWEKDEETKEVHAYILEDHSGHLLPKEQTKLVVDLIISRLIPEIIIEQNQGAGFILNDIETTLKAHHNVKSYLKRELRKKSTKAGTINRTRFTVQFHDKTAFSFTINAIHAKVGKVLRAGSVSIHYEMGLVHHPPQGLPICSITTCSASLEDQMVLWDETKKDSPDRMDAAVYTLLHIFGSELALSSKRPVRIQTPAQNADLPQYDPLTSNQPLPQEISKYSRAYTVDIGGSQSNDFSDRPRIAGPR